MVTRQQIRLLAQFKSLGFPVVTLYLHTGQGASSNTLPEDYKSRCRAMLHQAKARLKSDPDNRLSIEEAAIAYADFDKISAFVDRDVKTPDQNGLVIIACGILDCWEVFRLACPVTEGIFVDDRVYLRPLIQLQEENRHQGVAVIGRESGWIFSLQQCEVTNHLTWEDPEIKRCLPRRKLRSSPTLPVDSVSFSAGRWNQMAATLEELTRTGQWERVLVAGASEQVTQLATLLPLQVRSRVSVAFAELPDYALPPESLRALESVQEIIEQVQRAEDTDLLERVVDLAGRRQKAVLGLQAVLQAVQENAVRMLILERDCPPQPGCACRTCGRLAQIGMPPCPICGADDVAPVYDLLDAILRTALQDSIRLRFVEAPPHMHDWKVAGGLGGLLCV